jgi:hypothetical protein
LIERDTSAEHAVIRRDSPDEEGVSIEQLGEICLKTIAAMSESCRVQLRAQIRKTQVEPGKKLLAAKRARRYGVPFGWIN